MFVLCKGLHAACWLQLVRGTGRQDFICWSPARPKNACMEETWMMRAECLSATHLVPVPVPVPVSVPAPMPMPLLRVLVPVPALAARAGASKEENRRVACETQHMRNEGREESKASKVAARRASKTASAVCTCVRAHAKWSGGGGGSGGELEENVACCSHKNCATSLLLRLWMALSSSHDPFHHHLQVHCHDCIERRGVKAGRDSCR